jgi:hypothetical protein
MIKRFIKLFIPKFIINYRIKSSQNITDKKFKNMTTKQVFKLIYDNKIWTPEKEKKEHNFYSGFGSHNSALTKKYILKIKTFLKSFNIPPSIVELGCGDFKVSSELIKNSKNFKAFDIHNNLIKFNKKYYKKNKKVKFGVLDFTLSSPPKADICIIRCVLQHLSNEMIIKGLKNIRGKYKYLLITEHCPSDKNFTPNLNIISGPGIRLHKNSGVDISKTPFNIKFLKKKVLCRSKSKLIEGCLETTLYKLK